MATKRIKDLTNNKYTGYVALDDSTGTGKFLIDNLIESIAPMFDFTTSYTAGQSVMYQGTLYTFNVDHPAGAWDVSHVDIVNTQDNIRYCPTATETDLNYGTYIPIEVGTGKKKLPGDCVAPKSIQNNIIKSIAKEFIPNRIGGYKYGELFMLNGALYFVVEDFSGDFDASKVHKISISDITTALSSSKTTSSENVEFDTYSGTGWLKDSPIGGDVQYRSSTSDIYGYAVLNVSKYKSVVATTIYSLRNSSSDTYGVYAIYCDENMKVLQVFTQEQTSATKTLKNVNFTLNGSVNYLLVNMEYDKAGTISFVGSFDDIKFSPIGLGDIAEEYITYETEDVVYTIEDYGVKRNGSLGEDILYKHAEISVSRGDEFILSGASYWWLAFFVFKEGGSVKTIYPVEMHPKEIVVHENVYFKAPADGVLYVTLNADDTNVQDGASIKRVISSESHYVLKPEVVNMTNLGQDVLEWIASISSSAYLSGKKIYDCGDSVMRGAGTGADHEISEMEQIADLTGAILTHEAKSGYTLGYKDSDSSKSIVQKMIADLTLNNNYDYIVFQGGFNDISHTPLGAITPLGTTSFDASTTVGALETICYWLLKNCKQSKILFILDHKWYGARATQPTYWDAIVEVLKKWSIPYVDIYNECPLIGFDHDMRDAWFYFDGEHGDGLHPNTAAYTHFYVRKVMKALEAL